MPIGLIGNDFITNTSANSDQYYPSVAALPDGRFVVTWSSFDNGGNYDVRGRVFNADGTAAAVNGSTGDFLISASNASELSESSIAALPDGRFFLTWNSDDNGVNYDIRGRLFLADGTAAGDDFIVNTTTVDEQFFPKVAVLANGHLAVAFHSFDTGDGSGECIRTVILDPNVFQGTAGGDTWRGGAGADTLFGNDGNDTLYGNAGNDRINGGRGSDAMSGGGGDDLYYVTRLDTVTELFNEGTDKIIANVDVAALADNVENLTFNTAAALNGTGNGLANLLYGNAAANALSGLAGADRLFGNGGADTLAGGAGADRLWGGADADTFRFASLAENASAATRDTIRDFAAGIDTIDLTGLGFSSLVTGAFTGVAGQLRVVTGANTSVTGDVNGDRVADFYLALTGAVSLTLADFDL